MADVSIEITADLGDTEAKLTALRLEMDAVGHSGENAGESIGGNNQKSFSSRLDEFSRAMDDATRSSHRAGVDIMRFDQLGQDAEAMLTGGGGGGSGFIDALSGAASGFGEFLASIGPVATPLAVFAALVFTSWTVLVALTDILGTAVAVLADFVAPLLLVTGLLGGLAAAFGLSFEMAANAKTGWGQTQSAFAGLTKTFRETAHVLSAAFLPYFLDLIGAAKQALLYIDKLAKMPLAEAFHNMATQGVQMLTKFLEQAAHVIAKPIRLAFQIAFGAGPGGNEASSAVSAMWNQLQNYLFGYTERHPIELRPGSFKIQSTTVDGVFQPLIDWFNRHNFSKQGFEIGAAVRKGFLGSGAAQAIGNLLLQAIIDGAKKAATGMVGLMRIAGQDMNHALIMDAEITAQKWTSAFESVVNWIISHWRTIMSYIEQPLQISISWPSPPGWLTSLLSGVGGLFAGSSGGGATRPTHVPGIAAMAMGGGVHVHHHYNFYGGTFTDAASRRREANAMGQEIARNWRQRAGG